MMLRLIGIVIIIFSLGACAEKPGLVHLVEVDENAILIEKRQTLINALRAEGVSVVIVGDNVLLVLASDQFFPDRQTLDTATYPTLTKVAALLRTYKKYTVKVAAYTDLGDEPRVANRLTEHQAGLIARFIEHQGIDSRLLYAQGYGLSKPVTQLDTPLAELQNRRIEITTRSIGG